MLLAKLILLAGVCHLGILCASALTPKVLDWRSELRSLSNLSRHLVWTHGWFIVMTILGLGVISLANASDLASGAALARWFCAFVAVFWGTRLVIQLFVFDATPFLTTRFLTVGYHGLTVVFTYLTAVYAFAALGPR
jgi:hypothetical protein